MPSLRESSAFLEDHPWLRGLSQGVALAIGLAIAMAIVGRSWAAIVVCSLGAGFLMAVVFGVLLSLQRGGRPRVPRGRGTPRR